MAYNYKHYGSKSAFEPGKRAFHHYTDAAGVDSILNEGRVRPSTNTNTDAYYGKGVYGTSSKTAPETHTRSEVAQNNYDGSWQHNTEKTQYCMRFRVPQDQVDHCDSDRDVMVKRGGGGLSTDYLVDVREVPSNNQGGGYYNQGNGYYNQGRSGGYGYGNGNGRYYNNRY